MFMDNTINQRNLSMFHYHGVRIGNYVHEQYNKSVMLLLSRGPDWTVCSWTVE